MEVRKIESVVEALLFATGDPISIDKISEIVEVDKDTLRAIIEGLANDYNYSKKGIRIITLEDKYQMTTRGEYSEYVRRLIEPRIRRALSQSTMEALAVISYKQPATRQMIEQIRGVNCDYAITRLLERGLIEEKGRLDVPGRPVLFGTTDEFLRCFGISSLRDLPELEGIELSVFKEEHLDEIEGDLQQEMPLDIEEG